MNNHENTIRNLLALGELDPRTAARVAWVKESVAALRAAQQKVSEAWDRTLARLPDDISDAELEAMDLTDPPGRSKPKGSIGPQGPMECLRREAEVDALWAKLNDVVQKDRWPRELYFGGL